MIYLGSSARCRVEDCHVLDAEEVEAIELTRDALLHKLAEGTPVDLKREP